MEKNVFRKGLVLVTIVLFIGIGFVPNIIGDIEKISDILDTDIIENTWERKNLLLDPPEEEWNKTFGGTNNDYGFSVQQTTDGGYITTGYTSSLGAGGYDVWLIKTDSNGSIEWDETFGGTNNDCGNSVQQTTDGGYIIAGYTTSYGSGSYDVWLIKTDSNGSIEWNETYGGINPEIGFSVQQTTDGGYIITGDTASYGTGLFDVWLIKTDSNGSIEWNETYGGTNYDYGQSVQQTTDGGYIITGRTNSYGAGHYDVWLIKTDSNGSTEWDETFGGGNFDFGYSVKQTTDGGYIVTGWTRSYGAGDYDFWLIKTDSDGNKEWDKTYGGATYDEGYSVQQTTDGGYTMTGHTSSYGAGSSDAWLIKTDSDGNEVWNKTFGGTNQEWGFSVQQTADGGYIISGGTSSYGAGSSDVWLIKVEAVNNPPNKPSNPFPPNNSVDVNVKTNLCWTGGDPDGDNVTYDIYLGKNITPKKLISNITYNCSQFDLLDYNTTYYWQIVAWDDYNASRKGSIWCFTTKEAQPDLNCIGKLNWADIEPGATVTDNFNVENIGENGSLLDWKVDGYPAWGEWSFIPIEGNDLKPEDESITVQVMVVAPNEKNTEFTGIITIVNKHNESDFSTIDVSLSTPKNKPFIFNFPLLNWLFGRFQNIFPIFKFVL